MADSPDHMQALICLSEPDWNPKLAKMKELFRALIIGNHNHSVVGDTASKCTHACICIYL